ncbi:MAG: 1,4-alpha-glucan branching enzyme, partial [Candidatus Parabeggiatoa sp.]|nr:1,4-alpha-glucan branching enzyme [Candidatus Parabeggiatoa sp.]
MKPPKLEPALQKLVDALPHDPFSVLGKPTSGKQIQIRVCLPDAEEVMIAEGNLPMRRIPYTERFEWQGTAKIPDPYRLIWRDKEHREHITHDPSCFGPQVSDFDMH